MIGPIVLKAVKKWIALTVDASLLLAVMLAAILLKFIRKMGMRHFPMCKSALLRIGVFPIQRHYFEPQFDFRSDSQGLTAIRTLPGLDWNTAEQLKILHGMNYHHELLGMPRKRTKALEYHLDNGLFEAGDADYWYQLIRLKKPARIIEIGGGYSTLIGLKATARNAEEDPATACAYHCIEPYEASWLNDPALTITRQKVETLPLSFFAGLDEDDVLFIDSSHIIRPQGDVLFLIQSVLPALKSGVIVHFHDIFTPNHYPLNWLRTEVLFWNEQYLLEAFLTNNNEWKIIGALNFLRQYHFDELLRHTAFLNADYRPGSFYIQKL